MAGSKWPTDSPALQQIYPIILKSYEPLLYQGMMLDFVNGRAISRNKEQNHNVGHQVMISILHYIDGAPSQYKSHLRSMVKALILEDNYKDFFASASNIANYQKARALVDDAAVTPRPELIGHFNFPAIDRSVHRRPGWVFALAMLSSRLGNFECMNKENRKGWFTGDGMIYLYNGQQDHYTDYWPVVDSHRLAGTTVDAEQMLECKGQRNQIKGGRKSTMHWVGSVKLAKPMLSIVRKDALAHAVYDKTLNLLAANVWEGGEVRANDQLTTFDPMAIMVQQEAGLYQVVISDPTQLQTTLRFKLHKHMTLVDDPQNRVQINAQHELVVDVSGLKGQSYHFSVR